MLASQKVMLGPSSTQLLLSLTHSFLLNNPTALATWTTHAGKPTRLESRFRLTYNMIINLLRQEGTTFQLVYFRITLNEIKDFEIFYQ